MLCYNCGANLTEHDFCTNCGAEVGVYKKIMSSANLFYNEGLDRANVRDLTGAITALRQCIKMNKNHVDARNLLGLVYFEMGEYVAALSEWVISKNLRPSKNIADDYLNMMQSNQSRLDTISQTIKKYNQALSYCYQGSYDLAIIQLKKVVSLNPKHVQGRQLLALLYLHAEQWEDARRELERCRKIDINNTTTLRYLKEAESVLDIEEVSPVSNKKKSITDTITYHRGNETIIQPINGRENKISSTIINIIIGIAIGIAVACLLILPARISAASDANDEKLKEFAEQVDEKNSTINALEQEKNSLQSKSEKLETELATYTGEGGAISSMDNLLNAVMAYLSNPENTSEVATYLDMIDAGFVDTSTETFRLVYNSLRTRIGTTVGSSYYEEGMRAYQNDAYDEAVTNLTKAYEYDENNVDALYNLANAYRKSGDKVNAIANYQTLVERFPDSELASRAQSFINELVVD